MNGIDEAIKEAPKKAAKAVVTGIVMNQTKKALDSAIGKEESAKIFQANDNNKVIPAKNLFGPHLENIQKIEVSPIRKCQFTLTILYKTFDSLVVIPYSRIRVFKVFSRMLIRQQHTKSQQRLRWNRQRKLCPPTLTILYKTFDSLVVIPYSRISNQVINAVHLHRDFFTYWDLTSYYGISKLAVVLRCGRIR